MMRSVKVILGFIFIVLLPALASNLIEVKVKETPDNVQPKIHCTVK